MESSSMLLRLPSCTNVYIEEGHIYLTFVDLVLYVLIYKFSVISGLVFLG